MIDNFSLNVMEHISCFCLVVSLKHGLACLEVEPQLLSSVKNLDVFLCSILGTK